MIWSGTVLAACFVISCFASASGQLTEGSQCTTKRGHQGVCKTYANCPEATRDVKKGIRPWICGFKAKESFVCCVNDQKVVEVQRRVSEKMCWHYASHVFQITQVPTLLPEPEYINETECAQAGQELIIGGVAVAPKEFPHMVNLGYGQEDAIEWKCGATLISERWLLTAAHCLADRYQQVEWARLGDLVMDSDDDQAQPQTIRIAERIKHPGYLPPAKYHDIALLRLAKDAVLGSWVRPACLDTDPRTVPGDKTTVTGWGRTAFDASTTSKVLMKVTIPIRTTKKCNETYQSLMKRGKVLLNGIDEASMICAGDERGGKDTCAGDSGGPLQRKISKPLCMYSIIGVTSFGVSACGAGDNPSVYTRVSHYLPWIEGLVWPPTDTL